MRHSPFFPALLALLLVHAACGGKPPPSPDAGTQAEDAGTTSPDAGTGVEDAGTTSPDAGAGETDGGTTSPLCGTGSTLARAEASVDQALIEDPTADILDRLRAIPGLTVQENPSGSPVPSGYRFFVMEYDQPADHSRPECQRFKQRITLLHKSDTAPMVLYTSGYYLSTSTSRRELTLLLDANQLSIEHRFFPPSRPEPADWSLLTIKQSAADFHRIVQAFKPIYSARWLSTGASKGGETVVFFRRFYPQDVDATVAYVAPLALRDDARFPAFLDTVGGPALADCRARLHTFQRTVLERREEMVQLLREFAQVAKLTYEQLGFERALEQAVIDTYFAFWQYDKPENCNRIPGPEATIDELLFTLSDQVGLSSFADTGIGSISYYAPYYYQASVELGWTQSYVAHLGNLIHFPGTGTMHEYVPPGIPMPPFRDEAMQDIQDWVSTQGERLMFIYGEFDPWSAAAYSLGDAKDSYLYTVPGGNHSSNISRLPEEQYSEALSTVLRWANVTGMKRAPVRVEPRFEEFAPHLPPRLKQHGIR